LPLLKNKNDQRLVTSTLQAIILSRKAKAESSYDKKERVIMVFSSLSKLLSSPSSNSSNDHKSIEKVGQDKDIVANRYKPQVSTYMSQISPAKVENVHYEVYLTISCRRDKGAKKGRMSNKKGSQKLSYTDGLDSFSRLSLRNK